MKKKYKEIEHILYLYPYAFGKNDCFNKELKSYISQWLEILDPVDKKIIELRFFQNHTYDFIAIQVGYANHSSIIRRIHYIISILLEIKDK